MTKKVSKPVAPAEKFEGEIAALVSAWVDTGKDLVPAFITKALVDRHIGGLARANEHTPFFEHYTYKGVRQHVGTYISNLYDDKDAEDDQVQRTLPGFEFLQRRYIVKRGHDEIAVAVEHMTSAERQAKAQMLRRRGKACYAHADEMDRFDKLCSARAAS